MKLFGFELTETKSPGKDPVVAVSRDGEKVGSACGADAKSEAVRLVRKLRAGQGEIYDLHGCVVVSNPDIDGDTTVVYFDGQEIGRDDDRGKATQIAKQHKIDREKAPEKPTPPPIQVVKEGSTKAGE